MAKCKDDDSTSDGGEQPMADTQIVTEVKKVLLRETFDETSLITLIRTVSSSDCEVFTTLCFSAIKGHTLLEHAVLEGYIDLFILLLEKGLDPFQVNEYGNTALLQLVLPKSTEQANRNIMMLAELERRFPPAQLIEALKSKISDNHPSALEMAEYGAETFKIDSVLKWCQKILTPVSEAKASETGFLRNRHPKMTNQSSNATVQAPLLQNTT